MTRAQVVDGEFVVKKEIEVQEKEQNVEGNAKARATKAMFRANRGPRPSVDGLVSVDGPEQSLWFG